MKGKVVMGITAIKVGGLFRRNSEREAEKVLTSMMKNPEVQKFCKDYNVKIKLGTRLGIDKSFALYHNGYLKIKCENPFHKGLAKLFKKEKVTLNCFSQQSGKDAAEELTSQLSEYVSPNSCLDGLIKSVRKNIENTKKSIDAKLAQSKSNQAEKELAKQSASKSEQARKDLKSMIDKLTTSSK